MVININLLPQKERESKGFISPRFGKIIVEGAIITSLLIPSISPLFAAGKKGDNAVVRSSGTAVAQAKNVKENENQIRSVAKYFVKGKTTKDEAIEVMKKLGLKGIYWSQAALTADGLGELYLFTDGVYDFCNPLGITAPEKIKNWVIWGNDKVLVITAENYIKEHGVLLVTVSAEGRRGVAYHIQKDADREGGFREPYFIDDVAGGVIILHAKNDNGEYWKVALGFDRETGEYLGEINADELEHYKDKGEKDGVFKTTELTERIP